MKLKQMIQYFTTKNNNFIFVFLTILLLVVIYIHILSIYQHFKKKKKIIKYFK